VFETQGSSAIWLGGADDRGQRQRRYAPFEFVLRRSGKSSLHRLVKHHGVHPSRFVLEITEGVLLEATDRINAILDAIRAMGFKTALDDSGPAMRAWPIYAISGSTRSR
jgi:hypothetical protein